MKRWLREPLVRFPVADALRFGACAWRNRAAVEDPHAVGITAANDPGEGTPLTSRSHGTAPARPVLNRGKTRRSGPPGPARLVLDQGPITRVRRVE